jgi:hypothetical protein
MVRYMDTRYGRNALRRMVTAVTNEQALAPLRLSEAEFLAAWQRFIEKQTRR